MTAGDHSPPEQPMRLPTSDELAAYTDGLVHAAGSTHGARTIHVHPVSNYSFGSKAARHEKDASVAEAMLRHKASYQAHGLRRSVEAVLLVNQRSHPHVLLLRSANGQFKLPGGRLKQGEGEVRPSHEPNFYPYLPAHCTTPKEQKSLYISELPAKCVFAVPKNTKLLAVPLFELYGNEHKYGALIASIPHLVSRYQISLEEEEDAGEKE